MRLHWQISVGQLFDVLLPALVACGIVCSTWVLADARRRGLKPYALGAWTLATLALPFTFLPLYLIARRRTATDQPRAFWSRPALTLIYAVALSALAALYFWHDYRSLDAHLARASGAKLHQQHARAAGEYAAALRLADDPHTHKLLGLELGATGQWADALAELRAAERGSEPDAALPYHIANALAALGRRAEAFGEYRRFLAGSSCTQSPPDARCAGAQAYVHEYGRETEAVR